MSVGCMCVVMWVWSWRCVCGWCFSCHKIMTVCPEINILSNTISASHVNGQGRASVNLAPEFLSQKWGSWCWVEACWDWGETWRLSCRDQSECVDPCVRCTGRWRSRPRWTGCQHCLHSRLDCRYCCVCSRRQTADRWSTSQYHCWRDRPDASVTVQQEKISAQGWQSQWTLLPFQRSMCASVKTERIMNRKNY